MLVDTHGMAGLLLSCLMSLSGGTSDEDPAEPAVVHHWETLPTVVVGPPKSEEYPEPICSKCKVVVTRSTETGGDGDALLSLFYDDDLFPQTEGDVNLTLLMSDGTQNDVQIPDVFLVAGDEVSRWLAPGSEWTWSDVDYVWVRVAPST